MPTRYAELHPEDLQARLDHKAPAVIAWGALEWHGDHLPLGLDGIVAEWFAEQLAEQLDGVLLPPIWLPMTTLPHEFSLQVSTATFKAIVRETLEGLANMCFETVVIVTGHYAQGHLWELFADAVEAMDAHFPLRVFAAAPLAILHHDELLDHAGRHETAQFLHLRPDLVRTEVLEEHIEPRRDGVLGEHPNLGSAEEGHRVLYGALEGWVDWIATATTETLKAKYAEWTADLSPYRDRFYRKSWEQAILDWWATK